MKKLTRRFCWVAPVAVLFLLSSIGFSATVVKTFRDGTDGYTGTTDTYIDEVEPDAVPTGADVARLNINFGDSPAEHTEALLKFDLSSIPSYATVTSANLILTETRVVDNDSSDVIIIDKVTSTWSETTTWNTRPSSTSTTITTPAIDSITPGTTNTYIVTGLESLVQSWVTNAVDNFGIKLSATNSSLNFRVLSREDATETLRPALEVTYTVPDPVLTLIIVTPSSSTVAKLGTLQYSAIAFDQFGVAMSGVTFTWSVTGAAGTSIDSTGLLTAGSTVGSFTVKATSASVEGTASGEVLLGGTIVFQNGLNGYTGTDDTLLNQFAPTNNNGASSSLYFNWDTNSVGTVTENIQTLMRFQLSSIPTNAIVKSATLTVINTSRGELDASDVVKIGILTNSWTESSTYASYTPAYVDSGVILPSVLGYTGASEPYVITNLAAMIQSWVSVPPSNLGFMIHTPSDMLFRIASSESSTSTNRPKLEISYVLPAQVLTSIAVTPNTAVIPDDSTQTFVATAYDQAGNAMDPQPASFTWSVNGGGTIDSSGLFTATTPGSFSVTASASGKTGLSSFQVANVIILQESATYAGTTDTYIDEISPTNFFGDLDRLANDRVFGTNLVEHKQSLIKFNLSSIPTNAMVVAANLNFKIKRIVSASSTDRLIVHQVTSAWNETTTWNSAPTSSDTGILLPVAGFAVDAGYSVTNLGSIVQGWVAGSSNNDGLKIFTTNGNLNYHFYSSEFGTESSRPALQVIFTVPSGVVTDSDGDTLPDSWEMDQFGNLSFGAGDDVDGDGHTNLEEYSAGTAGNNASDKFCIYDQSFTASNVFVVYWPVPVSAAGKKYTIEYTSDLVSWTPLVVDFEPSGVGGYQGYPDPTADTVSKRFYRIKTQ